MTDAGQRAATAATVTVMAAGLVGALSTLPWDGQGCGDVLTSWHEYVAFLFAVQGIFTGLATLVWLLVSSAPDAAAGTGASPNRVRATSGGLVDGWFPGLPDPAGVHSMQASKWLGRSTDSSTPRSRPVLVRGRRHDRRHRDDDLVRDLVRMIFEER